MPADREGRMRHGQHRRRAGAPAGPQRGVPTCCSIQAPGRRPAGRGDAGPQAQGQRMAQLAVGSRACQAARLGSCGQCGTQRVQHRQRHSREQQPARQASGPARWFRWRRWPCRARRQVFPGGAFGASTLRRKCPMSSISRRMHAVRHRVGVPLHRVAHRLQRSREASARASTITGSDAMGHEDRRVLVGRTALGRAAGWPAAGSPTGP
jgi:hypothetical protein